MPTFVDLLNAREWTFDANCVDYSDMDAFFLEPGSGESDISLSSVRALNALLLCVSCPVRIACAEEGFAHFPGSSIPVGIFGGSTHAERQRLRHLPIDAAIDILEEDLASRIRRRAAAVALKHPKALR
jgi:Transcription factor WhiB